jgi:hypothetical protein
MGGILMRKYLFILFSSFFFLNLSCTKTQKGLNPNLEVKEEKEPQEVYSKESCYNLVKNRDTISFSLTASCIPATAKYVEVIYDSDYYGYFLVNKPIYLPMFPGQIKLIVFFSNELGKTLGIRNQFLIK